jgi:hypothetical protein
MAGSRALMRPRIKRTVIEAARLARTPLACFRGGLMRSAQHAGGVRTETLALGYVSAVTCSRPNQVHF